MAAATKPTVAQSLNPVPEWLTTPVKSVALVITSAANTTVRVALNIEAMVPLSEETVSTVLEGRKVIELLSN